MTCQQVQNNVSLYLYGELEFAREEELEQHLAGCAFCQQALACEKAWHSSVNSGQLGVSLELLSSCRQDLKANIGCARVEKTSHRAIWRDWLENLSLSNPGWAMRVAAASFLLFAGFAAGRWAERYGLPGFSTTPGIASADLAPVAPFTRVREVRPGDDGHIRLLVEQVRERELSGRIDDNQIRGLILAATRDPNDPALRVDSIETLNGQTGNDVRDALIASVRQDPNAAVRLKALEGLRQFPDALTREALKYVLQHDDDASVRAEAIDLLAPVMNKTGISPELANTLQEIIRSQQVDDYVRMRSFEILREINAPVDVY
ncbi:MAG: HEAT repeat domain-containing protein [Acidobacteriaceae bacterium]|nr:HEAT repeat domain-containing protein [Acidobacteriaceae bacterium]